MNSLVPGRRSRTPNVPRAASPFFHLQSEMNRLFDDAFMGRGLGLWNGDRGGFSWPSVEVSETDKEMTVTAELPGLSADDVEIRVDDDVLTISGEKHAETEDKERQYSERYYGRFERRLALPGVVDDERAKASFKNGVLTVTLPKAEPSRVKAKRIPIG